MSSARKSTTTGEVFEAIQEGGLETFKADDVKEVLDQNPKRITYELDKIAEEYDLIEKIDRTGVYTKRDYQHTIDYNDNQISDIYERKALDELVQSIKHTGSISEKESRKFVAEFFSDFQTNGIQKKGGKVISEAADMPYIEKDVKEGVLKPK